MGSTYLNGQTGLYGLPATLPAGLDAQASTIVNNFLGRPEGVLYKADRNGNPAFMSGASPVMVWTTQGAINPGTNVSVAVTPKVTQDLIGEVLVLDRASTASPNPMEAVVVASVTDANTIVLRQVQFAHLSGIKAESGMVITEERSLPAKRSIARYSKGPCVSILSMLGKYGYGRRSDQAMGLSTDVTLLSLARNFGDVGWNSIDPDAVSWSDASKEIWVPAGDLLAYYTDVKIKYIAGWPEGSVPGDIVQATALVASSLIAVSGGGQGVKVIAAGDTRIERFSATNIDADTKRLLSAYKAMSFW